MLSQNKRYSNAISTPIFEDEHSELSIAKCSGCILEHTTRNPVEVKGKIHEHFSMEVFLADTVRNQEVNKKREALLMGCVRIFQLVNGSNLNEPKASLISVKFTKGYW